MDTDSLFFELVFFASFSKLCEVYLLKRTDRETNVMGTNRGRTVENPSPR
jgi:hypothetical protein